MQNINKIKHNCDPEVCKNHLKLGYAFLLHSSISTNANKMQLSIKLFLECPSVTKFSFGSSFELACWTAAMLYNALVFALCLPYFVQTWQKKKNYYPGRGCGLTTPFRYFLIEPDDKSLLKCAFVGEEHFKKTFGFERYSQKDSHNYLNDITTYTTAEPITTTTTTTSTTTTTTSTTTTTGATPCNWIQRWAHWEAQESEKILAHTSVTNKEACFSFCSNIPDTTPIGRVFFQSATNVWVSLLSFKNSMMKLWTH